MWDLRSQSRDRTYADCIGSNPVLTTGLPGKSPKPLCFFFSQSTLALFSLKEKESEEDFRYYNEENFDLSLRHFSL